MSERERVPRCAMQSAPWVREGLAAGAAGATLSGIPSTLHALATGRDPLEAALGTHGDPLELVEEGEALGGPGWRVGRRDLRAPGRPIHLVTDCY